MPQHSPPPARSSHGTRARPLLTAAWAVPPIFASIWPLVESKTMLGVMEAGGVDALSM